MKNNSNLKPWPSGTSGNSRGKPKGTKHLSTQIKELMFDKKYSAYLNCKVPLEGPPIKALVLSLMVKASEGDVRAFELLAKYGFGNEVVNSEASLPTPILMGLSICETTPRLPNNKLNAD